MLRLVPASLSCKYDRFSQSVMFGASAIPYDGTRELHRGNWLVCFQQRIHFYSSIGKFDRKPYAEIYVESTKLFFCTLPISLTPITISGKTFDIVQERADLSSRAQRA